MSAEAFCPNSEAGDKETVATLITTGVSSVATDIKGLGPDLMISCKTQGFFFRFGTSATTVTASGTAATQGMWLPVNTVIRIKKPVGATHFVHIQDTAAATVYIQAGGGI